MKFHLEEPSSFLKNYIKHYCFMESDVYDDDVTERVIPTESVQLMFHYKNPFIVHHQNRTTIKQPRSIISGLSNSYSDVSSFGEAGVVFVTFYPNGACHFFDFPLSHIENKSLDLSEIYNIEIMQVEENLILKKTIREKTLVIEDFLTKRFSPIPSYDNIIIQKGIEIIKLNKGQTTAKNLSGILSITPKSLERKFSQYLGKTTKQIIKLIRFQEVISDLSAGNYLNLTEYAYRNGYFDQAHFIKDFKAYSGLTPKKFVSKYSNKRSPSAI